VRAQYPGAWLGYIGQNVNPVQSVDYRQSGVILTVTPDIHESIIDLDISQELSSFVATTTGINNSPTLLKRTVNSRLSIRSGEVVIFAGLNETKSDQTQSRFF
jgi:general secretion pathway protein D